MSDSLVVQFIYGVWLQLTITAKRYKKNTKKFDKITYYEESVEQKLKRSDPSIGSDSQQVETAIKK